LLKHKIYILEKNFLQYISIKYFSEVNLCFKKYFFKKHISKTNDANIFIFSRQ